MLDFSSVVFVCERCQSAFVIVMKSCQKPTCRGAGGIMDEWSGGRAPEDIALISVHTCKVSYVS